MKIQVASLVASLCFGCQCVWVFCLTLTLSAIALPLGPLFSLSSATHSPRKRVASLAYRVITTSVRRRVNEGAVVNGKYALSNRFSVRPGVITELNNDDGNRRVTVLAPVTYDFNGFGGLKPFVGAGAGVSTGR